MTRAKATSIFVVLLISLCIFTPAHALSDESRGHISQYCGSIRHILQQTQREDSRARIAVGAVYETLMTKYITPLNIRLVSNNNGHPDLVSIQSDLSAERTAFSAKFIEYSRSLESLIATDCQVDPDGFYAKLEYTRTLRTELAGHVATLRGLANDYGATVSAVKENL